MTDTYTVAAATADDIPDIAIPIRECGLFSPDEAEGFVAYLPDLIAEEGAHWRVLRHGDRIAGACYLSRERMSEDVWNLWFIGLRPGDQGGGGGSLLMAEAERTVRAEGGRLLLIETSLADAQEDARGFYAARGYGREAVIREYYAPGEDKIVFRRAL